MRVSKSSTETDHPHKQQEVQAQHLDNLSRKMSPERRLNHSHSRQQNSSVHLSRKYFMDCGFTDLEIERKNFCLVKDLGVCFVWWPSVCISKNEGPLLGSPGAERHASETMTVHMHMNQRLPKVKILTAAWDGWGHDYIRRHVGYFLSYQSIWQQLGADSSHKRLVLMD